MFRKLLLPILFMAFFGSQAMAQTGSITGTVTNESGEPVPTANVLLVEINRGAATNLQGEYTIENVEAGIYTLRVSFVGYQTYEDQVTIEAGETLVKDVTLSQGALNLQELVVTAMGIERSKRSLGYAVEEVQGELIAQTGETGIVGSLVGQTAGVMISASSGSVGAPNNIKIRGNASITGSNQPLFVINGVPIASGGGGGNLFSGASPARTIDIDPNIIKSITILKGAAATALYGARAANGVVLITTKGGSIGNRQTLQAEINTSVTFSDAIIDGFQDEYLMGTHGKYTNGLPYERGGYVAPGYQEWQPGSGAPRPDPQTLFSWGPKIGEVRQVVLDALGVSKIPTYNPREQFYETGVKISNNVSISGGTDKSSYYFSVSNLNHHGIVPNSKLTRTTFFARFNQKLSDRFQLNIMANYIDVGNVTFPTGNTKRAYTQNLNSTALSFNIGNYKWPDGTQRFQSPNGNNPLWLVKNSAFVRDTRRFIGSMTLSYDLASWLYLQERIGVDTFTELLEEQWNKQVVAQKGGQVENSSRTHTGFTSDLTLHFDYTFNDDWTVFGLIGNTINARGAEFVGITGDNLSVPGFYDPSNASSITASYNTFKHRIISVYGTATINYKNYIYLTLTGRNDWSSTLPLNSNSYFYPSASVGFIFSKFLSDDSPISFGKLRVAYAQVGNDAEPYSIYANLVQANPNDGVRGFITYPFSGVNGFMEGGTLANLNLKPEKTVEYEVGLELQFFNNRLHTAITYYNRLNSQLIFPVPIAPASGYTSHLINAGSIRNKGWEIALGGTPIRTENFIWDIQLNFTKNETLVENLAPGVHYIEIAGYTAPDIRVVEGLGYGIILAKSTSIMKRDRCWLMTRGIRFIKVGLAL